MASSRDRDRLSVFDIWGVLGVTRHPGGPKTTKELVRSCGIGPGQLVLDIGCGTGYTAAYIAKQFGNDVVALDINEKIFPWAKKRIERGGVGDKVALVQADAENLPFKDNTFDRMVSESVTIFCDAVRVASEAYRVLKPGGVWGDNELTYLVSPPREVTDLLSEASLGICIQPRLEAGWREVFRGAGFSSVQSTVHQIDPWQQLMSDVEVNGFRIFTATVQAFLDPAIRAELFRANLLQWLRQYRKLLRHLRYGLYVGKKD